MTVRSGVVTLARLLVMVLAATSTIAAGCAAPRIEYHPVPDYLIPREPELPKIESAALQCLSDQTYIDLANRDRALRQDNAALRALLGVAP